MNKTRSILSPGWFTVLALVTSLVHHDVQTGDATTKPPNIVLLFADDLRNDTLGCAGNPSFFA